MSARAFSLEISNEKHVCYCVFVTHLRARHAPDCEAQCRKGYWEGDWQRLPRMISSVSKQRLN